MGIEMKSVVLIVLCCIAMPIAAEPGRWHVDYGASHLGFTAEQAGAKFNGEFKSFEADVRFDPNALGESSATVSIATGSVATENGERDGILRGTGWFESETFPKATFSAHEFAKTDTGYVAKGELEIRSVRVPVAFQFTLKESAGHIELTGTAKLDRLALGLGLGDWADTKWIGKDVDVTVTLVGSR
jgi:polyisoprenoid-binding protein YceI